MTQIIALENFSLVAQGHTISLVVAPGQSLAIFGPAASGKTRLLECIGGEKPAQGVVHVLARPAFASPDDFSKRTKPQTIFRHSLSGGKATHAAEALTACGLWDHRKTPIVQLSPSQRAACELLPCLGVDSRLLVIDGQLDRIDPWTLASVLDALRKRTSLGAAVVAVTNRPELLSQFDLVIVLEALRPLYAGPVEGLLSRGPKAEIEIQSQSPNGVRALVAPFRVHVEQHEDRVIYHTATGQELAAKLLLEGYGDVEFVVVRESTAEQALLKLPRFNKGVRVGQK
jgi:ABC-type multidrug transport system ATPase subunit